LGKDEPVSGVPPRLELTEAELTLRACVGAGENGSFGESAVNFSEMPSALRAYGHAALPYNNRTDGDLGSSVNTTVRLPL